MAKTWNLGELTREIANGNKSAIMDAGKRFPLATTLITAALAGDKGAVVDLMEAVPERVSVGIINNKLKEGLDEDASDADDTNDTDENDVSKTNKNDKAEGKGESEDSGEEKPYESMGAYPLYQLCKKRGLDVKSKRPKEEYIAALKKADKAAANADDADNDEDGEDETDYTEMSAKELFKECKKRGLEVEKGKKAKYYIEKLEADDKKSDAEPNDDEDDWGDDEDDETPAKDNKSKTEKNSKGNKSASSKKDDDDEDWDI